MAVQNTLYVKSASINGASYDNSTGGTIRAEYSNGATPVEDRTGEDFYSKQVMLIGASERVRLTLRNVKVTTNLGSANATNYVILSDGKGNDVTINFGNLILYDVSGSQDKDVPGSCVLSFVHQATNPATNPVT